MLTTENVISLNLRSSYLNINITVATASNYILFWFLGYFQKTSQHDDSHSVSTFNHRSWKEREDSELIALLNIYMKFIFLDTDIVDKHQYNQFKNAEENDDRFSFLENLHEACPSRISTHGFSIWAESSSPNF